MRLDQYLSKIDPSLSRNKAAELIKKGAVEVDGKSIKKPSFITHNTQHIKILSDERYVGRGAYKLKGFMENFHIDATGLTCLDIGSSTGGFVQILLEYGAAQVYAVDVGTAQLHASLTSHPKVSVHENTDIRDFYIDADFKLVTCDVSFIPTTMILKEIDRLSTDKIIILFKPQFEVGREVKRNHKGKVKNQKIIDASIEHFITLAKDLNWSLIQYADSTLSGKEGNLERLFYFKK